METKICYGHWINTTFSLCTLNRDVIIVLKPLRKLYLQGFCESSVLLVHFMNVKKTTRKTFKFDLGNDLIQMISTFIFWSKNGLTHWKPFNNLFEKVKLKLRKMKLWVRQKYFLQVTKPLILKIIRSYGKSYYIHEL